jgi:hypothetical protein
MAPVNGISAIDIGADEVTLAFVVAEGIGLMR